MQLKGPTTVLNLSKAKEADIHSKVGPLRNNESESSTLSCLKVNEMLYINQTDQYETSEIILTEEYSAVL
ncbi:unnamed protein product [Larinioides sclopetarius]|uniref:Uncharacterized protein n=1 Tax=Larinioides sclopetarius TaxID=280406 RepID=A0AAV2A5B0_9ARAC